MTNYDMIKNATTVEEMAEYFVADAMCMDDPGNCSKECTCKECWIEYLGRETVILKSPYKPCPFCGGEAKLYINSHENSDTTHWHKIKCQNFECGAELGDALSKWSPDYDSQVEKLKERWNKRVQ